MSSCTSRASCAAPTLRPNNTVTSDKVADAHISYSGKGVIDSSNRMGWLARFFNSVFAPY